MQRVSAAALALGAAAAAAIWWITQHQVSKDSDGDDGADGSGGKAAASEAAAGSASLSKEADQAASRAPGSTADLTHSAGIREEQAAVEAAAQAERERRAAVALAARQSLARATRNELIVHEMLLAGQEGDVPFLAPLEAEGGGAHAGSGAPARLAAGRGGAPAPSSSALPGYSLAALAAPPADEVQALQNLQQAVAGTIEQAFFDALADGLRRGETDRLAALLLDARDQLAALLPQTATAARQRDGQGGTSGGEAQALLAELMEKLDADYVSQRLRQYDPVYCAQAFDLLVHTIGRLQAPARCEATQQMYAEVSELFAAAAAGAGAAVAAGAASAGGEGTELGPSSSAAPASAGPSAGLPAAPHLDEQQVQLVLEAGSSGRVGVRLIPPQPAAQAEPAPAHSEASAPASAVAPAAEAERVQLQLQLRGAADAVVATLTPGSAATAAAHNEGISDSRGQPTQASSGAAAPAGEPLRWELRLVPSQSGDGSLAAVMAPVGGPPTPNPAEPLPAAEHSQPDAAEADARPLGGAVSKASIAAVVAAARFMHRQLNQLRGDVAAAHLALLKEAILGSGSGIEYERQRYARALQAASAAAAAAEVSAPGGEGAASAAVAEALPITAGWLRQTLLEAPPPSPDSPQRTDPAFSRACIASGLLLLLQRPQAVSSVDCPEMLLLDLPAIVALQNELQRLSLLAASLLIVRQILAHKRALPPGGSPAAQALAQRVLRRMGALLSSGPPLEALVLELHQQAELALAQHTQQAPAGSQAAAAAAAAGDSSHAAAAAQEGATQGSAAQGAQQAQQAQQGIELELVRRMVQQIFSTEHTAYRRVQAGVVAAVTALLRSAASTSGGGGGGASWRVTLRGIGAELLAPEVHRLAAALDRVAAVSAAVGYPLVYRPLLAALLGEEAVQAALQRRRH